MLNSLKYGIILTTILFELNMLTPSQRVNKIFIPYYEEFIGYVQQKCKEDEYSLPRQIVIDFGNPAKDTAIATCSYSYFRFTIDVDKEYWDRADEDGKYATIFHELSHCILHMEHVDDPKHYMFAYDTKVTIQNVKNQLKSYLEKNCSKEK